MAHWKAEYSAALAARDRREKANAALYEAYTQLADRSKNKSPGTTGTSLQETLSIARADLSEAQRSRSELEEQLSRTNAELEKLRKRNTQDKRRIHILEGETTHLQLRLKDRDEELRGKAKLLDDFQDEMASLNLQLNMAEERSGKLQRENQELVDRWMARMGKEADAMNNASRFS
ncbi:hypothetical protein FE257_006481 [Aspergillus nanangensis]|uniref:Autophagy-related protein 16 domain-containing protein n=1 Tax=Aspergillus nanangensis TaxID=2582783 RepID=A0AAD4CY34_ASPNN|nr:hypothetical protein FE257_006481 [Aspergillus nanangensis]